jgi:hypothetical protein
MMERLKTFEEFWPFYVSQHSLAGTRALHFGGTMLVLGALVAGVVAAFGGAGLASLWAIPAAAVLGYGPAWVAHFFVEKNRPATFTYPWWSLRGDFRMWRLMLTGKMGPEVDRALRTYPRPG